MNEKLKLVLLKNGEKAKVVELPKDHEVDDLYKLLEVDLVDCCTRIIGGKSFDFWVDDEGLLKGEDNLFTSAYNQEIGSGDCHEILCGNVLISGLPDDDGNMTGLSDDDIALIFKNIKSISPHYKENPIFSITNFGTIRMKVNSDILTYQLS